MTHFTLEKFRIPIIELLFNNRTNLRDFWTQSYVYHESTLLTIAILCQSVALHYKKTQVLDKKYFLQELNRISKKAYPMHTWDNFGALRLLSFVEAQAKKDRSDDI